MNKRFFNCIALVFLLSLSACPAAYKARPLSFRLPETYPNATNVAGATVAANAFVDGKKAKKTFGFDIRASGMLPVQVIFDNQGNSPLAINPGQTFLEDKEGRLWPILEERFAYERVTKYAKTKKIFKEGTYGGFLGTVAGALVGAAIGVVSEDEIAETAARGAAAGAAVGTILGASQGLSSASSAEAKVMEDFHDKSLQNKPIKPGNIAYGFIFFPGEASDAKRLRLQLIDKNSGAVYTLQLVL